MQKLNRGTTTDRRYKYAGCEILWQGGQWIAKDPRPGQSFRIIATAKGIKPMRDVIFKMKINCEGPWEDGCQKLKESS